MTKITSNWISKLSKVMQSFQGPVPIFGMGQLPKRASDAKTAAVLIPLCNRHGEASVMYTVRTKTLNTHAGQVAFPGGHTEIGETSVQTAWRETYEECGNSVGPIQLLGQFQSIPSITGVWVTPGTFVQYLLSVVSHFMHDERYRKYLKITVLYTLLTNNDCPFRLLVLGFIEEDVGDLSHMELNPDEVDKVFTRSLQQLRDPTFRTTYEVEEGKYKGRKYPVFGAEDGDERIWGFTAIVTEALRKRVIIPMETD